MTEQWTNTRCTLSKLKKLLVCSHCSKPLSDPHFLASCKHTFCRTCIKNETCPECYIPTRANQITHNRLLANVILLTSQLQRILEAKDGSNAAPFPEQESPQPSKIKTVADCNGKDPSHSHEQISEEQKETEKTENNRRNIVEVDKNKIEGQASSSSTFTPSRQTLLKIQEFSPVTPGSALQKKNFKGETPLHVACIKGDTVKVKRLLEENVNLNVKDNAGWTALHEASHHNFLEIVELLVKHGAFIDTPGCDNQTPLHDAVQMNNLDVVCFLVRHGADTNARNAHGFTPFDLASTPEMKKALQTTVSLSFHNTSVNASSVNQRVIILCTALSRKHKLQIQLCAKMLKFTLVEEFNDRVTHIITDCDGEGQCVRTLKYLQGILHGKWILNYTWIELCIEYKTKIDEDAFEVAGTKNCPNSFGARKSRENTQRQLPQLFDGCHFYLYGTFAAPWPERSELSLLIQNGGGNVLKREPRYNLQDDRTHRVPYHFMDGIVNTFLIHTLNEPPDLNNMGDNVRCVHITWLLDSVSTFTLLPFDYRH